MEGPGKHVPIESNENMVFVQTVNNGLDILATVKQGRNSAEPEVILMDDVLKVVGLTKEELTGRVAAATKTSE